MGRPRKGDVQESLESSKEEIDDSDRGSVKSLPPLVLDDNKKVSHQYKSLSQRTQYSDKDENDKPQLIVSHDNTHLGESTSKSNIQDSYHNNSPSVDFSSSSVSSGGWKSLQSALRSGSLSVANLLRQKHFNNPRIIKTTLSGRIFSVRGEEIIENLPPITKKEPPKSDDNTILPKSNKKPKVISVTLKYFTSYNRSARVLNLTLATLHGLENVLSHFDVKYIKLTMKEIPRKLYIHSTGWRNAYCLSYNKTYTFFHMDEDIIKNSSIEVKLYGRKMFGLARLLGKGLIALGSIDLTSVLSDSAKTTKLKVSVE